MSDEDDLARIDAFTRSFMERVSPRVVPFLWGRAFLDERFPRRWDSNFLWALEPVGGVSADELAAEANRIMGPLGLRHRQVCVEEDAEGARLSSRFVELGYHADRTVVMVHRREPVRPARTELVEAVDVATIRDAIEESIRREPWATTEETVRMLADYRVYLAEHGSRSFAARVDGKVASTCDLYLGERIAMVEDVSTFAEYRNRGLGSAVVLRAVAEAHRLGCDLVFLHADANDWPQRWYARLGFDPVDHVWAFTLTGE